MKVFLGGTCNGSTWREQLKPLLTVDAFDPVVSEWNETAYQRELHEREHCDLCLYVLTPRMTGAYAVAEVVDDSNKRPRKTVACVLNEDGEDGFTVHQRKSLDKVLQLIANNGATVLPSLPAVAAYVNGLGST
jgi:hypothetical protein